MVTRQKLNEARRMIYNQHLAGAQAKVLPSGSAGRAKLELLAIYSNMKANELIAPQTQPIHGIINNSEHKQAQIDAKAPFEVFAEQVRNSVFDHITDHGLSFSTSKIRYCTVCKRYIYNSIEIL